MLDSLMISRYLESNDNLDKTSTLRRTRQSTKTLVGDIRFEFIEVESDKDQNVAKYKLDGKQHKIWFDDDEITKVSCPDCTGMAN